MNDVEDITHQPIVITELRCSRCGGMWIPRKATLPGYCPKCNSPYWNKPRRVKKSDKTLKVRRKVRTCDSETGVEKVENNE